MRSTRIVNFQLTDYKAFTGETEFRLAPLTIVLGRNNAGKSALCRAPLFATRGFLPENDAEPFPLSIDGLTFGSNLLETVHGEQLSGFKFKITFDPQATWEVHATAIPEQNYLQAIEFAQLTSLGELLVDEQRPVWSSLHRALTAYPFLAQVAKSVDLLGDMREIEVTTRHWRGSPPKRVGIKGQDTVYVIADAERRRDDDSLGRMNVWFENAMGVSIVPFREGREITIMAQRKLDGIKVPLTQVGAGLRQVLPLVCALHLIPPEHQPDIFIVEHPELHLHPGAHADIAELFLDSLESRPDRWLVIETHSDPLLLRLRAAIAEQRLSPDQIRVYFVDDDDNGSKLREISLDHRGTPSWWPDKVFAEPQIEFRRIRQALALRDQK